MQPLETCSKTTYAEYTVDLAGKKTFEAFRYLQGEGRPLQMICGAYGKTPMGHVYACIQNNHHRGLNAE